MHPAPHPHFLSKKSSPSFSPTTVEKLRSYQASLFENLLGGSPPLPPVAERGNMHTVTIVSEQPVISSENFKTLTSSNYRTVQYFLIKICTHFLLTNVDKRECGIYLFCLYLELYAKIKWSGFYTLVFYIFVNNSRSKHNKANPKHAFVDIIK